MCTWSNTNTFRKFIYQFSVSQNLLFPAKVLILFLKWVYNFKTFLNYFCTRVFSSISVFIKINPDNYKNTQSVLYSARIQLPVIYKSDKKLQSMMSQSTVIHNIAEVTVLEKELTRSLFCNRSLFPNLFKCI